MSFVIDKKAVWESALGELDELRPGSPMFWVLWNECFLDSVEDGLAIVGAPSDFHRSRIQQSIQHHLREALEEVLGYPVRLKVVVGNPRAFTKPTEAVRVPENVPNMDAEAHELALLHERYGDIMGIVDNHPLFKKAGTPLDKGGWGIWPQKLTLYCKDFGVMAVLRCLRYMSNKPSIRKHRGFFFEVMDKGQFGHKLVVSRDFTGPAREAG